MSFDFKNAPRLAPNSVQIPIMPRITSPASQVAENTGAIKNNVESISATLEKESTERKEADDKNMEYTVKQDKKNFVLGIIGTISGIVGALSGIAALIVSLVKP